jgi:glycosyltransferase involved in cell wall biosynthesis
MAADVNPRLRLILINYNANMSYLAELNQYIVTHKMQNIVYWLRLQETVTDMAALYRMADVMVSSPSIEGYGFTVYEAMACGCPTVISDLPAFEEDLVDGVHTIKTPVRDATAVSQAINTIINSSSLQQTLRQNGIQFGQAHNVANHYQQTMMLYKQLIESKKAVTP